MNRVHSQIGVALEKALGLTLISVEYMCFPHEVAGALTANELDGEVALHFERSVSVRLTWCQVTGWSEVNSLVASPDSHYKSGTLASVAANSQQLWAPHVGRRLCRIEALGWLGTPAIARLVFASGSVLVGVGTESGFRDGDCIIVRPDTAMWLQSGGEATPLWSTSNDA